MPACVQTEVGRRFDVNSVLILSRAALHIDFVELDKMQMNNQGVEHDLQ